MNVPDFVHSSDEHLWCFHFLDIVINADTNICVQVFVGQVLVFLFLLGLYEERMIFVLYHLPPPSSKGYSFCPSNQVFLPLRAFVLAVPSVRKLLSLHLLNGSLLVSRVSV